MPFNKVLGVNADITKRPPTTPVSAVVLLEVLEGWQGTDDWDMPTLPYMDTVREVLDALRRGDSAEVLKAHGKHTLGDCVAARCDLFIPVWLVKYGHGLAGHLQAALSEAGIACM